MTDSLRRGGAIFVAAGKELVVDHGPRLAASLTFYTLFSLVPLLFLLVAIAGFVFDDPSVVDEVVARVTDVAGAQVGDALESVLATVAAQRGGTLSIGLLLAAFSASGVFQATQWVLGEIFHVPETDRRTGVVGWLVRRAIALAAAIALAILAFTPILAVGALEGLVALLPEGAEWLDLLLRVAVPLTSVALLMAVTGVSFQALTAIGIPWKAAARGGVITALMGTAAAYGVGRYLQHVGLRGSTLGALGGVAILLIFFAATWNIYLFGAEVTKVYADYLEHGDVQMPSERHERQDRQGGPGEKATPARRGESAVMLALGAAIGWAARRRRR